jgi:uncharacterized protein
LPHQITKGVPGGRGYLDDYTYLAYALLTWAELLEYEGQQVFDGQAIDPKWTRAETWRMEGERLVAEMTILFYDEENGGFHYTSDHHEELFGRTKPPFDQPMPSANSIAVRCLLAVGDNLRARKTLESLSGWMDKAPTATEGLLTAVLDLLTLEAEPADAAPKIEIVAPTAPAKVERKEVLVKLESRELKAAEDGSASGKVIIEVPEGLHINSSEPPARWLTPTRVSIKPISGDVAYMPAENDRYEGRVEIPFSVRLPDKEGGADFEVIVSYQACTESECLLPEEKTISAVVVKA